MKKLESIPEDVKELLRGVRAEQLVEYYIDEIRGCPDILLRYPFHDYLDLMRQLRVLDYWLDNHGAPRE